jgi:hypothetical protein
MDLAAKSFQRSEKRQSTAQQLRLYLGPEKEYPERFTVEQSFSASDIATPGGEGCRLAVCLCS